MSEKKTYKRIVLDFEDFLKVDPSKVITTDPGDNLLAKFSQFSDTKLGFNTIVGDPLYFTNDPNPYKVAGIEMPEVTKTKSKKDEK
jgi:hypothetical protein